MRVSVPVSESSDPGKRTTRRWIWVVCISLFYLVWLGYVVMQEKGAELMAHYPIAVAMAFGSYFAGSTPMGGGTVGFPVLVLFFGYEPSLGRDFSFAIQSVGMVSASIFILCGRQHLEWPMLKWSMVGSLVGTPLGLLYLAPRVPALYVKLIFAILWAAFGLLHLGLARQIAGQHGIRQNSPALDRFSGLWIGGLGGLTVAAVTGVGVDLLIYAVLVLACRADLRIAIPTSVLLMAFTSLVGIVTLLLQGTTHPELPAHWLAAAPVVAVGAPLGAFIVHRIGRLPTLILVSKLCLLQFFWTLYRERETLGAEGILGAMLATLVLLGMFLGLRRWGRRHPGVDAIEAEEGSEVPGSDLRVP